MFEPSQQGPTIVAENELDETTSASLAFSDGEVFVRTYEHLYCIAADD